MFNCPKIKPYWLALMQLLPKFIDFLMTDSASFFLLHNNHMPSAQYRHSCISTMINVAKTLIPKYWKSERIPTIKEWAQKVQELYLFERLKDTGEGQTRGTQCRHKWCNWLLYTETPEYKGANSLSAEAPNASVNSLAFGIFVTAQIH
ncbi:hypothetical protein XELAEV_18009928mg [Xenopus laevis]|uniref:Uncharacterized protein n=1 Tax=Xenopus laevis TaxID=8355 RepID=A0A974I117_XENLA|nr:hypothetical protein XELAEV_18009928mg [Xenopus laevis]